MGRDAATHIVGTWHNQLGSRVELMTQKPGELTGTFVPGLGAVTGSHLLVGYYDDSPEDGSCTLGFVVRWPQEHSVTAWSGRYESGRDVIVAMWLLSAATPQDAWRATSVGCDEFRRL
ncbi:MAG TPA: avidin/streptavidin family protein [Acidimicrobiales bacterium]|nr:avidin/streptavidin family protein [Acidimicrobiales bacterium]